MFISFIAVRLYVLVLHPVVCGLVVIAVHLLSFTVHLMVTFLSTYLVTEILSTFSDIPNRNRDAPIQQEWTSCAGFSTLQWRDRMILSTSSQYKNTEPNSLLYNTVKQVGKWYSPSSPSLLKTMSCCTYWYTFECKFHQSYIRHTFHYTSSDLVYLGQSETWCLVFCIALKHCIYAFKQVDECWITYFIRAARTWTVAIDTEYNFWCYIPSILCKRPWHFTTNSFVRSKYIQIIRQQ